MIKTIRNPLGEEIPEVWAANSANSPEGKWAANLRPAPLGKGFDNTTAIGRATEVDIKTGWAGHLTPREIKDRWSRHGSVIPANHLDNHRNGTSCAPFESVRWGASWISRALKGWTPLAFLGLEWLGVNRVIETRAEHEGWAIGCPQWFVENQP